MFDISVNEEIVKEHYEIVKEYCNKKIREIKNESFNDKLDDFMGVDEEKIKIAFEKFGEFLDWLEEERNLERIITGNPNVLLDIYKEISEKFSFKICIDGNICDVFGKYGVNGTTVWGRIEKIFRYSWFREKYAYTLTSKLGVNICPYCNREFVFTVIDEDDKERSNIIRPELDHYFPQSKYPMFALSLYNLIPSGHICNSNIKGKKDLDLNVHLHPYIDEDKLFSFFMDMIDDQIVSTEIKIDASNDKTDNTIDFFKLRQIYKYHNDVSDDIVEIYRQNPPQKICDYSDLLKNKGLPGYTKEDILKILYHKYIVNNTDNEILGKLKNDLYTGLHGIYSKYFNKI